MKKQYQIVLLLLLILLPFQISAKCAFNWVDIYPKEKSLNQDGLIIVNTFNKKIVKNKKNIYLESGKEKIPLKLLETNKGYYKIQLVLKPSKDLTIGKTYKLYIKDYKNILPKWKVINKEITKPLLKQMKLIENKVNIYGCGDGAYLKFNLDLKESPIYIKTELFNITINKKNVFYISLKDKIVIVGHGMCSGSFEFQLKSKYKLRYKIIDSSGNSSSWSKWERVPNPFDNKK